MDDIFQIADVGWSGGATESDPLVHAQGTTDPFGYGSSYRTFLVSGCRDLIARGHRLYDLIDGRDGSHRVANYCSCRSNAWFVRHKRQKIIRVASSKCSLRWCPLCQRNRRYIIGRSCIPFLKNHPKPKFLTLTLRHSENSLSDQINKLYDSFKLLRKSKIWKSHIIGGIWFFQVKLSKKDNLWHPHLHILCAGRYLPQKNLSEKWLRITGDSNIVDIRAVKNMKKTADYVARYATAPCDIRDLDDNSLIELYDSVFGRRICGTFGVGKEIQLVPKKCEDADDWENIGSYWRVINFRHSDDNAAAIFRAWRENTSTDATMIETKPPPEIPDDARWHEPITYKQHLIEWKGMIR